MNSLAAIHVGKKQLGLDDDTYRSLLMRVTGKTSARLLNQNEQKRVLGELRKAGFEPKKNGLQGPFAGKLQALWIAAWNLGIVEDRRDSALLAFVKRQTGIDHTRFLTDAVQAARVIEALKGWMAREGGVDWIVHEGTRARWANRPEGQIALALWARLQSATGRDQTEPADFIAWVKYATGARPEALGLSGWADVQKRLGAKIREAQNQ